MLRPVDHGIMLHGTDHVSIPVTVTRGTSEDGDHGTLSSVTVSSGRTAGTGSIATHVDADGDEETFTVVLDTDRLPSSVTAGSPASMIDDTTTVTDPPQAVFPAARFHDCGSGAPRSERLNEISLHLEQQQAAMRWLVSTMKRASRLPPSIDSSNVDIIRAGLEAWGDGAAPGGRGLLNSTSLERLDALDLAREHDVQVIVTAAGESGMPSDTEERLANASRVVDAALARGIPARDIYVDPLVFPIAVDQDFGNHCLEAIRGLRERYGAEIHVTGGFSNVSFGMPARRLINDVFLRLAIDAGADSGILDPVTSHVDRVLGLDRMARPYRLAEDLLLGHDQYCATFIRAHRKGELISND